MSTANHPTLADLARMPIGDVIALPGESLALLLDDADETLRVAKTTKDWLDGAVARKYADKAGAVRRAAGKDCGTVRFDDGPVAVVADLPKKVDWDQAKLAAVVERIRAEGDDPTEYVEVSFKVAERKYGAWPSHIRAAFEAARTVRVGKQSFKLLLNAEGAL